MEQGKPIVTESESSSWAPKKLYKVSESPPSRIDTVRLIFLVHCAQNILTGKRTPISRTETDKEYLGAMPRNVPGKQSSAIK